ncbi:MAG: choice-of-anchor J domain-containing protein [Prevotellaceae bacterium]|nr:choice-of-anchor J domain-containing protein [Prevotellaceae bacterium]
MKGNFVAPDINGNVHDLQAYLDAGKTVVIDYSTVWSQSCWELHKSGMLDKLHNDYGPNGTGEIVVLWIEIDYDTTVGNIRGDGGNNSCGDWTNGGKWPVPIINDVPERLCLEPLGELYENFVPTVFLVCPNGTYREITTEIQRANGADLVYALLGDCPVNTSLPVVSPLDGVAKNYPARENKFRASFFSLSDATATLTFKDGTPGNVTWTAQGGTKTTATTNAVIATWPKAGTYDIKLEVTNANGTAEKTQTIEIVNVPEGLDDRTIDFETILLGGDFATDLFPHNWICVDKDSGNVYDSYRERGVAGPSSFVVVDKRVVRSDLVRYIEPYEGNKCAMSMANCNDVTNNDWLISPKMQLGGESSMSLYVRSGLEYAGEEEYQIAVSTTDQDPASFTVIGGKRTAPFEWTQVNVDLSAYNNREVYLAINNVGFNHFTFLVDNIEIKTKNASSVNRLLSDQFDIYPNPAKNRVHINCPDLSDIQLFNIQGKEVMSVTANSEQATVDVSNLPEGHYLVRVTTKENKFGTKKITVVKE